MPSGSSVAPEPVDPGRHARPPSIAPRWNWPLIVVLGTVHGLACLAALPWLFGWDNVAAFALGVPLFGQGINLGYHRLLSHRSLKLPRWLEHGFVVVALCCLQGTPISWVTNHRLHHRDADGTGDPHSPRNGFWWSHFRWLTVADPKTIEAAAISRHAKDLLKDRFYRRLQRHAALQLGIYLAHAALYVVAGVAIGVAGDGRWAAGVQLGLGLLVWGVFVRTIAVWHITWSVNSLTHVWGARCYATGDDSRNNWLIGIVAMGEGWHNNHHHDQAAATTQHRWWQIDGTYYVILLLRHLGLATEIVPRRVCRRGARG
jgi:fatty-acid desaturase